MFIIKMIYVTREILPPSAFFAYVQYHHLGSCSCQAGDPDLYPHKIRKGDDAPKEHALLTI